MKVSNTLQRTHKTFVISQNGGFRISLLSGEYIGSLSVATLSGETQCIIIENKETIKRHSISHCDIDQAIKAVSRGKVAVCGEGAGEEGGRERAQT